jgi:predicted Zn-dependent protease
VARNNLSSLLSARGKKSEAEDLLASTNKLSAEQRASFPRTWVAAINLAHMAYRNHDEPRALEIAEEACRTYPNTWDLVSFRAELLRKMRGPEAALPVLEEFTSNHWWHAKAFLALGRLNCEKGNVAQARSALLHASWLDIHDAEALSFLASMDLNLGYFDEAIDTQRRAVARQPDQPQLHLLLSEILQKMGRTSEAHASLANATRLRSLAQGPVTAN